MRSGPRREDLVLTGEAVALDLPVASVGVRAVAGVIDLVLAALLVVGAVLGIAAVGPLLDGALQAVVTLLAVVAVLVGLPTTVETVTRGRTLGKWVMGLRAVRGDAGPVSFRHCFVRALVGVVEIYLLSGAPALFSSLATSRGQRVGDLVAGTYVVRERFRLRLTEPRACPPHLRTWAASADLADPPVGLAVAVRQFLLRAPTLVPHHRWVTAQQLAASLAAYTAPDPPAGTHPEDFLAAVLAERRERDVARLRADVTRKDALLRRSAEEGRIRS
ncbi:RDD family protein [Nocardioides marmoribigeumensis]|uniref:RDD family membrane protein YckC n=1 Tax=Nocardioides marmoribigeumensis TaxID=433649 RepID=A0ABU2BWD4_9ACTN|nr:RDD family protein [Nocardioides marmoribigeumensis]MDR7362942.1 putative RDD family membrane protein YckC [Nocardioides marmoribigeumensis]